MPTFPLSNKILLLGCLLWSLSATAQNRYPLRTLTDSLVLQSGKPAIRWAKPFAVNTKADFPVIENVRIDNDDLVVAYLPGKPSATMVYTVEVYIKNADGTVFRPSAYALEEKSTETEGRRTLRWMDVGEDVLDFGTTYTLFIERSLMGAVNCSTERPAFTLKKQLPHYAIGTAALALIGTSIAFNSRSKAAYQNYTTEWTKGRPASEVSNTFFEDAKRFQRLARATAYTGAILGSIDALWTAQRWWTIRRKQQIYDKFCAPKPSSGLSLRPATGSNAQGWNAGIQLTWKF
jgi:hypothetical protein